MLQHTSSEVIIISIFLVVLCRSISLIPGQFSCIFEFQFICDWIVITSHDVCCNIRNVKFIKSYAVQANFCSRCLRFILTEI